jgi:ABC-type antimicrobial peptide transport system permease subunit
VAARVETEYYASLSDTNKQFLFAIIFVTVVMSIGGVLGVMNTMFAAVSQRIKDIGVLRLLGYSRRHIVVALLLESLLISLVGGLLGCLLGSFSDGWSATSIVAGAGMGKSVALKLVVDAKTLATGVVLTLIMGGLGGAVPALSAMRLTPLEALR